MQIKSKWHSTHLLEWLKFFKLIIPKGEETEKLELSCPAIGNVKLYNHIGKQFSNFLKSYNTHTLRSRHSPLTYYPRKKKAYVYSKTYTWMLIEAWSEIEQNWKPKSSLTHEWINKVSYIHTMEYYSTLKRNELLRHTTAWMNLKIIVPSERWHAKK